MATRITRSRSRQPSEKTNISQAVGEIRDLSQEATTATIAVLPATFGSNASGMTQEEFHFLELKQSKLRNPGDLAAEAIRDANTSRRRNTDIALEQLTQATAATLVFVQEEAGTAVCVSSDGLILTCSHCIAETREEYERHEDKWLIFASGQVVRAKCIAWDLKRDLALLKIIAAQASKSSNSDSTAFPSIDIATTTPRQSQPLCCIGHPGSEDLEASTAGIATDYDVLHISFGRFRGVAADQNPQYNEEIGALMHDCWTYWGHSGAPLVQRSDGSLVGLHSSWDDQTGMRRGVPLVAVRSFLGEHARHVIDG